MVKITLNGTEIEAPDGAPLVEVIKNSGTFISNLCYIDGRPPYAGCRTCIVEIEGVRGQPLSCTSRVEDGMIVRTETPDLKATRQAVLSLIMSYHSDRCLTCHRVVKCKPGDTCLRDDVVTHRCLTCSKNYRCELQTTCEMLEMAGYEPWDGDTRTYYTTPQPPPDQGNPFLEFDPQMCIICTRCVRACDELRHTGAITLAGRGYSTRIEFGQGGPVHDSNCDFCGACIDVCPTATLMEHPNKWGATQTERWVATTCTQCSVGCSISLGTKRGKGVIVRPDTTANPVSRDQLCVRGRFHYDAVKNTQRLQTPLIRRNGGQDAATWDEALDFTVARLAQVREEHGADAIGFLGSPLATNEENYLVSKIARAIVGTNNVDSSTGPVARAACEALRATFGSEVLPADMTRIAQSKTILVVAHDLESSHNVACLRAKDAAVYNGARVIVISPMWGELNDFAEVWVQPKPGEESASLGTVAAEVERLTGLAQGTPMPPGLDESTAKAAELLAETAADEEQRPLSVIYALPHYGAEHAKATIAALANIAIACAGENAGEVLFVLPQEANVWGMRDTGATPELLPAYRPVADHAARSEMERLWGAPVAPAAGLTFDQMNADGKLKALIVMNDNPLMLAPGRSRVRSMLESLDFLAVIDALPSDTANIAHVVLADVSPWAKEGTTTSADRRVLRLHPATAPQGDARQGWRILSDLGARLAERLNPGEIRVRYQSAAEIMDEISQVIPLYANATYREMDSGTQQTINGVGPTKAERHSVPSIAPPENGRLFRLTASRSLYTSYEGAAIHSPDADKLHREEHIALNPSSAQALGVAEGDIVVVRAEAVELRLKAHFTNSIAPGAAHVPLYLDGGAVGDLFPEDASAVAVEISRT
jgi:predicted molibdopterin-dependent oxidoreductase YjgC